MSDTGSTETTEVRVVRGHSEHRDIFDSTAKEGMKTWAEVLFKTHSPEDRPDQASDQGVNLGVKEHPFNMAAAIAFKNQNVHHSTCIEAKSRAMTGLGFTTDKATDLLDPLCDSTFMEVLDSVAEDYWQVGNGYMEVVRDDGGKVKGLHHVPAATVKVCIEDIEYRRHYIVGESGGEGSSPRVMAPYGELEEFLARLNGESVDSNGVPDTTVDYRSVYNSYGTPSERSEIIHFARRTSMSRWYGFPDWLSAVASIELVQMMTQERYDFFLNRGVPEFILFISGAKIDGKTWEKIENGIQNTIGLGNQHKTMAINVDSELAKIQVEKLAMEDAGSAGLSDLREALSLDIVTAHRTPPLLAGIQISGKLGAVNELPNALLAFQVLVIGPEQVTFTAILGSTLGNKEHNSGLGLKKADFVFKKVTEEIPLGMGAQTTGAAPGLKEMDTMSRMRTPAASASGRDLSAGVKD